MPASRTAAACCRAMAASSIASTRCCAAMPAAALVALGLPPLMMPHESSLLGATGSIGDSTLDVIARHPDRFEVVALAAHRNGDKLADLCRRHRPRSRGAARPRRRAGARARARRRRHADARPRRRGRARRGGDAPERRHGARGHRRRGGARADAGRGARRQAHPARQQGSARDRRRAFMDAVEAGGATLLPIDSEHNAIFQCLPRSAATAIRRQRRAPHPADRVGRPVPHARARASSRTSRRDEACAHPNWVDGPQDLASIRRR